MQWGTTPLLRAAEKGHAEIVRFLLENGSDVEEQNNVGGPKGVLSVCDSLMLFDVRILGPSGSFPNPTK